MSLFRYGSFTLHSGAETFFKIDCDALTDEDLDALVPLIMEMVDWFATVEGVPTGGLRLAQRLAKHAMDKYADCENAPVLIVDDVLTTGASMEEQRAGRRARGIVIFARGPCPDWVRPIFTMNGVDR